MRRKLGCILLLLMTAGITLRGQAREGRVEQLIAQGDSLHRAYLFEDAREKYMLAADLDLEQKYAAELSKRAQQTQNALNMTEFCADPHVVARERFLRKDFFQYYPLKSQGWHASPNPLDSLDGYPTYYPKGEKSIIYSAVDFAGTRSLFFTRETDTLWTAPRLLGESLTTMGSEIFPMLSPDGKTLYFASDGLYGMGGYDLYSSAWDPETNSWGEPENMGFPFNSPGDDFLLMDTEDGKYTIFASNRDCSRDSVYIYVLDYAASRVRKPFNDHREIVRIASLRPVEDFGRLDHGAFTETVEENTNTRLYRQKTDEARALRDSIARHASDPDPTRLIQLRRRLQDLNAEIEIIADAFLREGIVSAPAEEKEVVGAGLSYTFAKNNMGPRLRLKIARARRTNTFRVLQVGRLAQDNSLPEGIVYQIQFATATRHLSIDSFGGLAPVYERISSSLRYVYTVGLFDKYEDALMELNTVKKQGFPEASIVAWRDGRQISVSTARSEEKK
jgi:hypothetical protein